METKQKTQFRKANELLYDFSVSPDGKSLAYVSEEYDNNQVLLRKQLVIRTSKRTLKIIAMEPDWFSVGWFDNTRLSIKRLREPHSSTLLFDPFKGKVEQELFLDDPLIISKRLNVGENEQYIVYTYYDPTLTRVFYLRDEGGYAKTTLMDLQTGKLITSLPNKFDYSNDGNEVGWPVWLPGKTGILVESGNNEMIGDIRDLYSVSLDGQITRLTYLTDVFNYVRERGYRSSSDSRYIAFWLWAQPYHNNYTYLAILDTTTGKITNTCIPGYLQEYYPVPADPIWLPEGHQLIVEVHDNASDQNYFREVLVDLDEGFAFQIAENQMVWDWMLNEP